MHATVGLHPHEARHGVDTIGDLFDGRDDRPAGAVAVGECGLDYHYDHSPRDAQRDGVRGPGRHSPTSDGLPLVIHTREAWDDTFDVLDAEGVPARTVFHCFTGGPDEARAALGDGRLPQLLAGSSRSRAPATCEAAAASCPLDRTLVETDSPYLAPVPHRGQPNRPAWVPVVGARLAEVHGVTADRIRFSTAEAAAATRFASGLPSRLDRHETAPTT